MKTSTDSGTNAPGVNRRLEDEPFDRHAATVLGVLADLAPADTVRSNQPGSPRRDGPGVQGAKGDRGR
jgi:hypothetical protein